MCAVFAIAESCISMATRKVLPKPTIEVHSTTFINDMHVVMRLKKYLV
jgi:hypothetical protein